jgi:ABC-type hemin transport system ATPase subunit
MAVLAVVHDLQRAATWAERIVLIADGRVAAQGAPDAVLASAAAAAAFEVAIRSHAVAGLDHPLYSFGDAPVSDGLDGVSRPDRNSRAPQ